MTVRAAEDALERLLADPTVGDVHLATSLKWSFIALACLALGAILLRAKYADLKGARTVRRLTLLGAVACGCTSILLLAGQFTHVEMLTQIGALSFALELVLVGTGLWKLASLDDEAPLQAGQPAFH
jgi:choline-glycine betaine transporter